MEKTQECPRCGRSIPPNAPGEICPYCALKAVLDASPTLARPEPRLAKPPSIEVLQKILPDMDSFELIGQGGMGSVFAARQKGLDRQVAVKVLYPEHAENPDFAGRFEREARTLARLDHPNIVKVYDFGERDDHFFLVMELVEGITLREAITQGTLDPTHALALVKSLCDALQYAHDQGVVHRDIKPENVLLADNGNVKVADFGLVKLTGEGRDDLTLTRHVMGTPHYMSPEQVESPDRVDHRADIYALGVVLYEMLTGELPMGRFEAPSRRVQVDVRLDEVVLKTLEKEPSRRYQQANELSYAVDSLGTLAAGPFPPGPSRGFDQQPWPRQLFEYRSKASLFGLPLLHVVRGGIDHPWAVARGIVAIGDAAVGVLAMGGAAYGVIALGGFSVGFLSLGGITLGLLCIGGLAVGGAAFGGGAAGWVADGGMTFAPHSLLDEPNALNDPTFWTAGALALVVVAASLWIGPRRRSAPDRE